MSKTAQNIKQKIISEFENGWNPGLCWLGVVLGLCVIAVLPELQFLPGLAGIIFLSFCLFVAMWIGTENNNGLGGMVSLTIGIALGMLILIVAFSPIIDALVMFKTGFSALVIAFASAAGIYSTPGFIKILRGKQSVLKGDSS